MLTEFDRAPVMDPVRRKTALRHIIESCIPEQKLQELRQSARGEVMHPFLMQSLPIKHWDRFAPLIAEGLIAAAEMSLFHTERLAPRRVSDHLRHEKFARFPLHSDAGMQPWLMYC